ncbi:hypothetical protein [Leucobacter sp. M11]|uniref:hypothetical protein n=1 Tax=Leucobacter sp. M11 TaxID=2993565 RepID=UPI002D7E3AC4|nr:hypothetical protein [Leucobacter sp. M11]MEB4614002.1 hypothetical protein [Leucobacter sp. M11]
MKKLALALVLALTLSGCASVATTEASEYPATFRSVEELKEAFVSAGGACPDWHQSDLVKLAAQSGTCSEVNVLSIFSSKSSQDEMISSLKTLLDNVSLLVGENWVINDPSVGELDPGLGGVLVTS